MKPIFVKMTSILVILFPISTISQTQYGPNIILMFMDDMGYGDMGANGQSQFTTPNLDKMAAEGMLFTDFYSASTVCAPSRVSMMLGQHTGHTGVVGNVPKVLVPSDVTLGEILKEGGYNTAYIGKWGVGSGREAAWDNPTKLMGPNVNGFDYFLGYLNNGHAHNCFPPYLVFNGGILSLNNILGSQWQDQGNPDYGEGVAQTRAEYAPFVFRDSAVSFIKQNFNKPNPFFLIYALNIPHTNNEAGNQGMEVPDYGEFSGQNWPDSEKGFAQMMRYIDNDVGTLMKLSDSLGISHKTLILFTSDNGPHSEGGHDPNFFDSNGEVRGKKRDLWDGGVRMPMIAWWPGVIKPGSISSYMGYSPDFMPTFADLAGVTKPSGIDGISFAPTLIGDTVSQIQHQYLYWEFGEGSRDRIAVRMNDWKYVKHEGNEYLYDLNSDLGEQNNILNQNTNIADQLKQLATQAHEDTVVAVSWSPQRVKPIYVPIIKSNTYHKMGITNSKGYIISHFYGINNSEKSGRNTYTLDGKIGKSLGTGVYIKETDRL